MNRTGVAVGEPSSPCVGDLCVLVGDTFILLASPTTTREPPVVRRASVPDLRLGIVQTPP